MKRTYILAAAATVALVSTPGAAKASVLDNPFFEILGLVIVAGYDGATAPVVGDFVLGVGGSPDLIGSDRSSPSTSTA